MNGLLHLVSSALKVGDSRLPRACVLVAVAGLDWKRRGCGKGHFSLAPSPVRADTRPQQALLLQLYLQLEGKSGKLDVIEKGR